MGFIQAVGKDNFVPSYLFDEGSTITWVPCGKKLTCEYPGVMLKYGSDTMFDKEVSVLEMDGEFTQSMVNNKGAPGSNNGSGFFQALAALKLRGPYEKIAGKKVEADVAA